MTLDHRYAVGPQEPPATQHHVDTRVRSQVGDLPRDLVRQDHVVRIQEHDVIGLRHTGAAVACRGRARIVLIDVPDSIAIGRQHRARVVGRAVIHHDDLYVAIGLPQYAVDRPADHVRPIERRNDHCDGSLLLTIVHSAPYPQQFNEHHANRLVRIVARCACWLRWRHQPTGRKTS